MRAEEIVLQAPDGRSVTTLVNATSIRSEEGEVESVVVTMQDMTPMEELERLRAEFLGMVSHELRTPLTSIKGSAATLTEAASDLDPAEMLQFFRIIGEQADYMRDLIGDLLDVARIETGELSVAPAPADVATLVDEARSRFQSGGGRSNLRIDLPPELPLVMADGRRIIQVLNNLLTNAARHSHEASAIGVSAVREGYHVAVSVTDEGRGIAAERLPHLFRKFSRIDGEDRRRDIAGSGLGLAICKGIVEAHGGRIWAESDGPGLGARFTFTIPVAQAAAIGAAHLPVRSRRSERERERILAVDDDPQTLRYVRDALTNAGYAPIVTGDPQEATSLVRANDPHLVLLDLMLPGTDGIELMGDILDMADVPVIFLSAYGQEEIIARAFEMGADDYVVKPFSPTELVARIKAALRKREAPEWAEPSEPYVFGQLTIDYAERRATLAGRPVQLTAIEYGLLFELSANAGRVMTYDRLLQRVWGLRGSGDSRRVRTAASWATTPTTPPTSSTSPASAIAWRRRMRRSGGRRGRVESQRRGHHDAHCVPQPCHSILLGPRGWVGSQADPGRLAKACRCATITRGGAGGDNPALSRWRPPSVAIPQLRHVPAPQPSRIVIEPVGSASCATIPAQHEACKTPPSVQRTFQSHKAAEETF